MIQFTISISVSLVSIPLTLLILVTTDTLALPLLLHSKPSALLNLRTLDNSNLPFETTHRLSTTTPNASNSGQNTPSVQRYSFNPSLSVHVDSEDIDVVIVRGTSTDSTSAVHLDDSPEEDSEETSVPKRRGAAKPRHQKGYKPFWVQIDTQKFYGGLITYSHPQHPARVCRVMNACVRPDGTLVLPRWLKRHDNTLSFHCGHSKLEFSLSDTRPPPVLKRFDLVGLTCPRPSMPDFLTDFIPSAVVFDLVYGDHEVKKSCHSRKGRECDLFPGLMQDFKPAVFLHQRLKLLDEKKSWVREFVKMMKPPKSGLQPKIQYSSLSHNKGDEKMKCYRSAFFTRGPYNKNFIMSDHLRNIHFLEANGIGKAERQVMQTMIRKGKERKLCHINVTISNRQLVDGASNRLIGRYIINIPELRKAIPRQAKRIPGLKMNVATMTLEGKTLRWQINAMQKTDIWVAGLGPLLTNMVFLRENSTVIELQPFAYYPKDYENMARYLAHVNYDRYIAHPDAEAFRICVHQLYPKKHVARRKALEILEKYTMAAEKYAQSDSTHSYVLNRFNETSLRNIHVCAQMQRLDTDSKNLAIAIVRHARLRCGLPEPKLQSNIKTK